MPMTKRGGEILQFLTNPKLNTDDLFNIERYARKILNSRRKAEADKVGLRKGATVEFEHKGEKFSGLVRRVGPRSATVLVNSAAGFSTWRVGRSILKVVQP